MGFHGILIQIFSKIRAIQNIIRKIRDKKNPPGKPGGLASTDI